MDNEWTEFNDSWQAFEKKGLNTAGTVIKVLDNDVTVFYLIGNMNIAGGFCNCCGIGDDTIILAYKRINFSCHCRN